jgi:outer membrane lipoprotein-sorting protein
MGVGRGALASLVLIGLQAAGANDDAARALDAWEARVKTLTSFTCRFRQEKKVSFMRRPLVSSGTMAYRDRRLLWKTEKPSPGFLSVDANEVRIYTPEFKTLEIVSLGAPSESTPAGAPAAAGDRPAATPTTSAASPMAGAFPGFTGDFRGLRDSYAIDLAPAAEGAEDAAKEGDVRLRFTPRTDELKNEVTAIEVTLDRDSMVKAWRIARANGDELVLTISDFVANARVTDSELTFDVPADVKVTRLGGGTR